MEQLKQVVRERLAGGKEQEQRVEDIRRSGNQRFGTGRSHPVLHVQ